jgi:hypothetical protein
MPNARHTDPQTSHEAAESVLNITSTQDAILTLLSIEGMTDVQLIDSYYRLARVSDGKVPMASESGIRSRRAELVKQRLVIDSGDRQKLPSGRQAIVWLKA